MTKCSQPFPVAHFLPREFGDTSCSGGRMSIKMNPNHCYHRARMGRRKIASHMPTRYLLQ